MGTYSEQRGCDPTMTNQIAFPDDPENLPIENKVAQTEWIRKQNVVYDDFVKGNQDYTALAKKHGITRAKAIEMVREVNDYIKQSGAFKEMAKERLGEMDHHYSMLIKAGWEAVEDMKDEGKKADKIPSALKAIADIEAKRQEALQKAGMYDDYEVGDMLAESERKIDAIKELLKSVITKYPETKQMILVGLRDIQDPDRLPEPDVVPGEVK